MDLLKASMLYCQDFYTFDLILLQTIDDQREVKSPGTNTRLFQQYDCT